jgi:hypothetical protein
LNAPEVMTDPAGFAVRGNVKLIARSHDVGTRRVTWPLAGKAAMMSQAMGRPATS